MFQYDVYFIILCPDNINYKMNNYEIRYQH
nr:MAG TPA: hypothetical protein [Caudoviricetes sp.]